MKDNPATTATVSDRALEMIMRDVLDGLFELSLESSLCAEIIDFEILEIRPTGVRGNPHKRTHDQMTDAEIIDFPNIRRACG